MLLHYHFFLFPVQCPAHEVRFDSTGVILSPGYPDNYPNLQMCSWLINVEKGYNMTLHFELFQTEKEFDILHEERKLVWMLQKTRKMKSIEEFQYQTL